MYTYIHKRIESGRNMLLLEFPNFHLRSSLAFINSGKKALKIENKFH
jgi:hypothetical protein